MTTTLLVGLRQGVARLRPGGGGWSAEITLVAGPVNGIAADPLRQELVYACASDRGLWRSEDAGATWRRVGSGITRPSVQVAAVSRSERAGGHGVVYVGTRMSAVYRSEDGGESFQELRAFQHLPSMTGWSFPPEPDTHHVRSLLADPTQPGLVLAGIELGGVVRTVDGGRTWEDQKPVADLDPHTLIAHSSAPRRMYIGGGASYCESYDGGATWQRFVDGLRHYYFFDLVVDPIDPGTMVMSAADDPFTGHGMPGFGRTWSTLYRRENDGAWEEVTNGLPERNGTAMGHLASCEAEPGAFWYLTVPGQLYRSADRGATWDQAPVRWPAGTEGRMVNTVVGVA
jgi:photosystem II stability/assembly factor-like uncharacterized protein